MSESFLLLFSTALLNNLVITSLVGVDLQLAASRRMNVAWLTGLATTCCRMISVPGAYVIDQAIILPFNLEHLDLLFYVLFIIAVVLISQNILLRLFPLIYKQFSAMIPLLLMNSVLLAVILLQQSLSNSFAHALFFGLGTGLGFLFLLLLITCLRERIENENIPGPFQGLPILLISLGMLSMGLMGLAGI